MNRIELLNLTHTELLNLCELQASTISALKSTMNQREALMMQVLTKEDNLFDKLKQACPMLRKQAD